MKVEVFESVAACAPRRAEWNDFAVACGSDVSLTYEWHLALERSQEAQGPVRTVWTRNEGRVTAILPLRSSVARLGGVPLRAISPLGASYSAHDCLLVRPLSLESLATTLDAAASALPSWDVFEFYVSEETPIFAQTEAGATPKRSWVEWFEAKGSPYLPLPGTFEDYQRDLSTKKRTQIRSRIKKLNASGRPSLRVVTRPEEVPEAIEIVREIERASWKEEAGTSITRNPYQVVFYDVLTRELAERGWLRLYLLSLDGRPIAHDIGFAYRGRFYSGKTSFVETLRALQPGIVLRWMIVADLYEQGLREHDFMGDPDPYKMHWTDSIRRHRNIRLLRPGARTRLSRWIRSLRPASSRAAATPAPEGV